MFAYTCFVCEYVCAGYMLPMYVSLCMIFLTCLLFQGKVLPAVLPLSTWVKTCLDPLSHNHMFFLNLLYTQYTHIWPYWPYPHYYPLLWLLENFQGLHSPCFFTSHTLNVNLCYTNFVSFSSLYQLQISIESSLGSNNKTPIKPILPSPETLGKQMKTLPYLIHLSSYSELLQIPSQALLMPPLLIYYALISSWIQWDLKTD